jgi:pimeloyl-ACP methyl ester carboxylesterase
MLTPRKKRRWLTFSAVITALLLLCCCGCGSFVAHRIVQAPNSYPDWFAPDAPVTLGFSAGFLTNFHAHFVQVGPPDAKLRYRIINPADYHFTSTRSNWTAHGRTEFEFNFNATIPAATNQWTLSPRGTVVLLHGYGLAQFSMAPWAIRLAEQGWRCVLVDLRGHGKSTGDKIFFGIRETNDLSRLLDVLETDHQLALPVAVMGESYGAAVGLRWAGVEPRVKSTVAIAPFVVLSNAVMNIRRDYVGWMPAFIVRAGAAKIPYVIGVEPGALDSTYVLRQHPVKALIIKGGMDTIMPDDEMGTLFKLTLPGSKLVSVPLGTHESVTYFFDVLDGPVSEWLNGIKSTD